MDFRCYEGIYSYRVGDCGRKKGVMASSALHGRFKNEIGRSVVDAYCASGGFWVNAGQMDEQNDCMVRCEGIGK
jgi:hypothetical protein